MLLIIIPMSGFVRFRKVGDILSLIISEELHLSNMFTKMFDDTDDFVFTCNNDHLIIQIIKWKV